jgi:molybdopterin-guanine dinucleotide biosynthesis protein A
MKPSDSLTELTVVIQAGGESRRMGQDKGLVSFFGAPLIARVAERFKPIAAELLITTNRPEDYLFLGLPLFSDILPGMGALGGLYTALSAARHSLVGVVACDMPFASPSLLIALRDELLPGIYDIAIPHSPDGFEPFHAVYRRETCLPHILAALQDGKRRVDAWFHAVKLRRFSPTEILPYDPHQLAFLNTNTPVELAEAETLAQEMDAS